MNKPNEPLRDFDASHCSSAFTYDEIIELIRRKQKFFESKWGRADSDAADMFMGMHAACGFLIADFAALALDKQKSDWRTKGLSMSMSGEDGICCVCRKWFMECLCANVVLMSKVIEVIDTEEEFDGDIPHDIFNTASASPEAMAEALRVACRLTKQGIKRRVEALR